MTALDERYGREGEPIAGFVGRAATCGVCCAVLVVVALAVHAGWEMVAGFLVVGVMLAAPTGGLIGVLAALVGAFAERAGRTPRVRAVLLASTGGVSAGLGAALALLSFGTAALQAFWPAAVGSGALGALLLLRLRRRTFREAVPFRAAMRTRPRA